SRRRHTSSKRDWSSDVCSSDLIYDNRDTVSELNGQLFLIIAQALLVGLLISVLLSFLLSKTMITPIERLTEGAERVAAGDFGSRSEERRVGKESRCRCVR